MGDLDYCERLKALGMYSQERRRERYAVIFIWKISEGLISGYDMSFQQSARRGRLAVVPPFAANSSAPVRNAREASLRVKGARLFNLLPKEIRDMQSVTVDSFKTALDSWLSGIPDEPTIAGRKRAALSNSLLDQVATTTS